MQNDRVLKQSCDLFDNYHVCFCESSKQKRGLTNQTQRHDCARQADSFRKRGLPGYETTNQKCHMLIRAECLIKHTTLDLHYGADATRILEIRSMVLLIPKIVTSLTAQNRKYNHWRCECSLCATTSRFIKVKTDDGAKQFAKLAAEQLANKSTYGFRAVQSYNKNSRSGIFKLERTGESNINKEFGKILSTTTVFPNPPVNLFKRQIRT